MGLTSFFKKSNPVGLHNTYGLTPLGKTKAEEYTLSGVKWQVLAQLNDNGASSISEVATEMKTNPEKLKSIFKGLIRSGYIRRVNAEE